jgi:hypothetical protein
MGMTYFLPENIVHAADGRDNGKTEKDTIRVVMPPGCNGEVVGFLKGATGKFDLLKYAGRDFKRVGL